MPLPWASQPLCQWGDTRTATLRQVSQRVPLQDSAAQHSTERSIRRSLLDLQQGPVRRSGVAA